MHNNFLRALTEVSLFFLLLVMVMLCLSYYRKKRGAIIIPLCPWLKNYLLTQNYLKVVFVVMALYFVASISYRHSGIGCDDLNEAAQCECYALKAMKARGKEQKKHWANNGMRMCPDSKFFVDYLKEVQ